MVTHAEVVSAFQAAASTRYDSLPAIVALICVSSRPAVSWSSAFTGFSGLPFGGGHRESKHSRLYGGGVWLSRGAGCLDSGSSPAARPTGYSNPGSTRATCRNQRRATGPRRAKRQPAQGALVASQLLLKHSRTARKNRWQLRAASGARGSPGKKQNTARSRMLPAEPLVNAPAALYRMTA